MPIAIYSPVPREAIVISEVLPSATLVSSADGEDSYAIGECCVTLRYYRAPRDFVSRQLLGCHNAVRTGKLTCQDVGEALRIISMTESVIGVVGPDQAVNEISVSLARSLSGVIVDGNEAIVA